MNEAARSALVDLVKRYGRGICDDPRRTEALLKDLCGEHRLEISVLIAAMRERVPAELQTHQAGAPTPILIGRLTKRLEDHLGLAEAPARWAVESWGLALGVLSITELAAAARSRPVFEKAPRLPEASPAESHRDAPENQRPSRTKAPGTAVDGTFRDVSTLAGTGNKGYADGPALQALFDSPRGLALDGDGFLYLCDTGNRRLRIISPGGEVSTLAGTGRWRDGSRDGPIGTASFADPDDIALDAQGTLWVAEEHGVMRTIRSDQNVRSLTVSGLSFMSLNGVSIAADGGIWVTDGNSQVVLRLEEGKPVRRIGPKGPRARGSYKDGAAEEARFDMPTGLAAVATGSVYVADSGNNSIRKIAGNGVVTTVAGTGPWPPFGGFKDGPEAEARFKSPHGLAVDPRGRIYVADSGNNRIRRVELNGTVTTIAGSGRKGLRDGPPLTAEFKWPTRLAIGRDGTLYVADSGNHCIRVIRV